MYTYILYIYIYIYQSLLYIEAVIHESVLPYRPMGWLRLVGSLKL